MELYGICSLLLILLTTVGNGAKILIMVTIPSPSIFNIYIPIIEALYERKHDVTLQSIYPLKKPLPGMKVLPIKVSAFGTDEKVQKATLFQWAEADPISEVYAFLGMSEGYMCTDYLTDESTKTLISEGKQFDLVIADGFSDCILIAAATFGKHVIETVPSGNFPWTYSDVPEPPSYVPNYYRRYPSTMTFWQRMRNAVDIAAFRVINDFFMEDTITHKYLPDSPTIAEVRDKQVAFTLTNGDTVMVSPRPTVPSVIDCGGLHCRDAQPLPKDLNDFVESSGDAGFIMFGLGTNVKSKYLPLETRNAILSAFSRLKQKVIWKFEAELENLPKNVMITKFMPQQDLLGHPKNRLFITHSGLLSLQEAIYHGVPVIGMPFLMDQAGNVGRIEELGMGEYMDFHNVTADGFYDLINKVLNDPSYRNNAKKYSAIAKDQPIKPLDKAIFWIEYVLRHDGMKHFHPASRELNFFQYFLLDVIAFLLLVATIVIGTWVVLIKLTLRKLCSKKETRSHFDKKQK